LHSDWPQDFSHSTFTLNFGWHVSGEEGGAAREKSPIGLVFLERGRGVGARREPVGSDYKATSTVAARKRGN